MFLNYPFVKQNEQKDCGVACLAMIIKYYKGFMGLGLLREMTNTNRLGTTAYDIVKTANEIGFESIGIKADLESINNVILPCIAHTTIDAKYNHYIVIYKINYKKKTLIIADPASSIKVISFNEFNKIWTNVLLLMHPIKNIPIYKKHSILKFTVEVLTSNKSLVISMFMLSFIITFFTIMSSFFIQILLSLISLDYTFNKILLITIIFVFIELVKAISDYMRNKVLIFLNQKIDFILTTDTYKNIITLPYNYYRNHTTGEIVSKINDITIIRAMISKVSLTIFIDLVLTIASSVVLFFINMKLFVISLIIFSLHMLTIIIFKEKIENTIIMLQKEKANISSYLVESINGFETIKGLNLYNQFSCKFESKYINFLNQIFNLDKTHNNQNLVRQIIAGLTNIIIISFGVTMIVDNELTVGSLLTFHMLLGYFMYPISNYSELNTSIKEAKHSLDRLLDMQIKMPADGILENKLTGAINIKNLNYGYDDELTFLKNINLNIKKGERLIITGHSGSGKSTLLKIIKKYYSIKRGMVYLDDNDINDYMNKTIDENVTYISQNETLFTDTIINNIKLNRNNVDNIMDIIKIFKVDKIIKNNLGYNQLIEENGFNISGGERQRIILARSFVDNKPIVLIDEGLSQIDINLEREILKNIFEVFKNTTIILTSHRLDNLDLFDHLIELNNGKIVKDVIRNG